MQKKFPEIVMRYIESSKQCIEISKKRTECINNIQKAVINAQKTANVQKGTESFNCT